MSFDGGEVARACVHCSDAPCQAVCPPGAITFLDDGIVQIHHDRCTGCMQCVPACPFEVIVMCDPAHPDDKKSPAFPDHGVATKCDRCLTKAEDVAPACVSGCPYGAATRGRPQDLFPKLRDWAEGGGPVMAAGGRADEACAGR
ncbi:MAG TPA: 4Fe-4S dicluster domain-containing protein [Gemmataceae bacterium]|nr:4Fe-4S dicluster domain-containing protein [Gemmataceae bacterium]